MKINKEEKQIVIDSIKKEFKNYQIIDDSFIYQLLDSIEKELPTFRNIPIIKENYDNLNEIVVIALQAKTVIYHYLCGLAEEDIDILIELTDTVEYYIKYFETKKKITVPKNLYNTDDIISEYQGDAIFKSYIVRYIIERMHGRNYVPFQKNYKEPVLEEEHETKTKKQLKKEMKLLQKQQRTLIPEKKKEIVATEVKEIEKEEPIIIEEPTPVVDNKIKEDPIVETIIKKESKTNLVVKIKEEPKELPKAIIKKKTVLQPGTAKTNFIIELYKRINIEQENEDPIYSKYISLRCGYLNNSYYTLEEIQLILNVSYEQVKEYELKMLLFIKEYVNNNVNNLKLKLKQGQ